MAIGALIVLAAVRVVGRLDIGDKPIGSLTLNEVFGALVYLAIWCVIGFVALWIAFGHFDRRAAIEELVRRTAAHAQQLKHHRARVASIYPNSKLMRTINDPEYGLPARPLLQGLLVIGVIVFVWLLIGALAVWSRS
jgi:hypothetical protein